MIIDILQQIYENTTVTNARLRQTKLKGVIYNHRSNRVVVRSLFKLEQEIFRCIFSLTCSTVEQVPLFGDYFQA